MYQKKISLLCRENPLMKSPYLIDGKSNENFRNLVIIGVDPNI